MTDFSLKPSGLGVKDEAINIRVQCMQYHPSVYKEDGSCARDASGEVFLDCTGVGVIEVFIVFLTYKSMKD